MTPNPTPAHRPAPPVPARPYAAPALTPLGEIASATAGPDKTPGKMLDMLYGGDGGFDRDATS